MRSRDIELPIDVGVYQSDSLPVANQVCTNLIPWIEQTEGTSTRGFLTHGFGIEGVVVPSDKTFKGFHTFKEILYCVVGDKLYRINADDTATVIGTFTSQGDEDPVIDDNGEAMGILFPDASLWFYDEVAGLTQCVDPVIQSYEAETGGILSFCHLKGVFVFATKSTMISGSVVTQNKGQDFDALDYVEPFLNDSIVAVFNVREELYVFGKNQTKPYGAQATGSFPFVEIGGTAFDKGLLNRYSFKTFDNSAVFIGGAKGELPSVWRLIGAGSVSKISTPFIDAKIRALDPGEIESNYSQSFKLSWDGHFLVGFTIGEYPSGETFIYDATSSALKGRSIWFKKSSPLGYENTYTITGRLASLLDAFGLPTSGVTAEQTDSWIVRGIAKAYGKFYTGATGVGIGRISGTVYQDYGQDTETDFCGYYLSNQQRPISINRLELIVESGVGNEWLSKSTPHRDPKVELFISTDRGRTFTSVGERSLGTFGNFKARATWDALGMADQSWLFRFKCSAAVKRVFLGLLANVEGGRN